MANAADIHKLGERLATDTVDTLAHIMTVRTKRNSHILNLQVAAEIQLLFVHQTDNLIHECVVGLPGLLVVGQCGRSWSMVFTENDVGEHSDKCQDEENQKYQ